MDFFTFIAVAIAGYVLYKYVPAVKTRVDAILAKVTRTSE